MDEQLWRREYRELGIVFDFTNEAYKPRSARIRALAWEGKGPLAWLRQFLDECKGERRQ